MPRKSSSSHESPRDRPLTSTIPESTWCAAKEDSEIHAYAHAPNNRITKAEARDLERHIAYVLRHRHGIGSRGPGKDVVLSVASLDPFLPIVFYGIVAAGAPPLPISELTRQIRDSGTTLVLYSKEYEEATVAAAKECNIPPDRVLVIDSSSPIRMFEWPRLTSIAELERITTCLLYSSGTTGLPKGVHLSHWNLVSSNVISMRVGARYIARRMQEGHHFEWRTMECLPMAHIAGIQQSSLNPFYMGGTVYWMEKYNFRDFIMYSRQYRTVYQFSVPPIWLQVAKSPEVTDHFDSLEVASSGAAPMGLELVKEVSQELGKGDTFMTQTWGATETDGSTTATDWDSRDETGTVGRILPNVKLRVVDDEGQDVEPGEAGELLVVGPLVCQGHHNTAASIVNGWFVAADVDNIKNHLIADAAVIGMQSERYGTEVPKAFIVATAGESLAVEEVMEFAKNTLASHRQ
ncbi:hypothetical protein DOTSEDRAFT_62006 [Dothistroma septosporum NZE10]|uniref:AMP-dependent synthetase/ligase domain-containing protein n=1 Tax=Dothistroma septosporum (strain NZE10 / CBS 128990) TaxID=675120 RepID=N1PPX9_DOTSN|nr:hypothetical protein DOTSEDRAFT_62006 [Dothistroma septosporum NZE10]